MKTINKIEYKRNKYLITIQNDTFSIDDFYYKVLYPYTGKEIDNPTLFTIASFSNAFDCLSKIYTKIYSNKLSTKEVYIYLNKYISSGEAREIVKTFKEEGYFDDEKFVIYHLERFEENKGINAFRTFLFEKGINEQLASKYLSTFVESTEFALKCANTIIQNKSVSKNKAKLLIKASLTNKGFSSQMINDVLNKVEYKEEDDALLKDFNKLKGKYENKKIISKLIYKGYNISSIKKVIKEDFDYED